MQFIDLKAQQTRIWKNIEKRIQAVLNHGKYIMGPEVFELEEKLAAYVGVKHCISCSSGTDALLIPLMAKGIGKGDAVLTTPFTYIATAEVIALLGAWEFHKLTSSTFNTPPLPMSLAIAIGLPLSSKWSDQYLLLAISIAIFATLTWHIMRKISTKLYRFHLVSLAGPFFIGVPLSFAVLVRDTVDGRDWLLAAILITFSIDTAAYSVGRLIGKRKFAPRISPGKTWEGAVGALIAGVAATVSLTIILELPIQIWMALVFGVLLVIAAISGDLTESWLKRLVGAKDSGTLIPGHGGVLDRTDSAMATLATTYFWVMWAL